MRESKKRGGKMAPFKSFLFLSMYRKRKRFISGKKNPLLFFHLREINAT